MSKIIKSVKSKKYLEAFDLLQSGTTNQDVIIGSLNEFSEEELSDMCDYLIINSNLIITASSGDTHDVSKNLIADQIIKSVQSFSDENSQKYFRYTECSVPFVDIFECGRIIDKHADSAIVDESNKPRCYPLVLEVAHGSESFKTLIIELLNYLSEFTDTIYAVGFYIDRESESFKARLIILRRKLPIDNEKKKLLLEAIKNRKLKRHFDMACPQGGKIQVPRFIIDIEKFISDNNAEIFFDYEINQSNLKNSIQFRLRADDFNGNEGQFINIVIPLNSIRIIVSRWEEWRSEKI